jgi:Tfp pilus assembly protein FimT
MKSNFKTDCRGFSLTELVVMLSITTIMAAVSIPMLTSAMQGIQLNADAKSMATTLTYARVNAAAQLTRYRMSLFVGRNEWELSKWNKTSRTYDLEQATNMLSTGISNSGIQFKASSGTAPAGFPTTTSNTITFDSRGIPMDGAGIIYLSGRNADYAITIAASGKIQLWRFENSQWNMK